VQSLEINFNQMETLVDICTDRLVEIYLRSEDDYSMIFNVLPDHLVEKMFERLVKSEKDVFFFFFPLVRFGKFLCGKTCAESFST